MIAILVFANWAPSKAARMVGRHSRARWLITALARRLRP
jgi:hypothetical protein